MFVEEAKRHAWIPAVAAASETGAEVWVREAGLDALEFGDEAVVEVADFTLDGRAMRNVRQMVNRVTRAGYACELRRLRRHPGRRAGGAAPVRRPRGGSATPSAGTRWRWAASATPATAPAWSPPPASDGQVRALIAFVPWGEHGLSLDLMRRDHECRPRRQRAAHRADAAGVPASWASSACRSNFAVFRAALARGERIGAGPGTRAWRRLLLLASRWAQIESLYRFNAKFQPVWEPRFILYPDVGDLPRVAVAYLEAEAFISYPRLAFWRGRDRRAAGLVLPA